MIHHENKTNKFMWKYVNLWHYRCHKTDTCRSLTASREQQIQISSFVLVGFVLIMKNVNISTKLFFLWSTERVTS